jgi:hypothetical protein
MQCSKTDPALENWAYAKQAAAKGRGHQTFVEPSASSECRKVRATSGLTTPPHREDIRENDDGERHRHPELQCSTIHRSLLQKPMTC